MVYIGTMTESDDRTLEIFSSSTRILFGALGLLLSLLDYCLRRFKMTTLV